MAYTNSSLVKYTRLSPNHSGARKYPITRITPHCVVGQLSVETLGSIFAPTSRQASCQYGIGSDGRVGMYVEEKNRAWTSSSYDNDNRAVTIECASDLKHPYAFNDTVYNKLIDLCVDICKRNGKKKLLWLGSKEKALSYKPKSDEMILTAHRWFASTACPGDWFYSREGDLAAKVTARLSGTSASASGGSQSAASTKAEVYRVRRSWAEVKTQIGAYGRLDNAKAACDKNPGYSVFDSSGKVVYTSAKKAVLTVDGYWGQLTTRRLQEVLGTTVDGFISGQSTLNKKYQANCEKTTFKYSSGGSQCIRALQKKLGIAASGQFDRYTITKLQASLKVTVDGYCGPGTVKALQTWLNKQ